MTIRTRPTRLVWKGTTSIVLLAGISLSGCATQPETKWIRNSAEGLFTKIPAEWKTFRIDPYAVDTVRLKPEKRDPGRWELLFDSAPNVKKAAARQHLESDLPRQLVGELSVQTLPLPDRFGAFGLRERLSLSVMRRFATFEFNDSPPPDPDGADEENIEANSGTNEIAVIEESFDPVDQFTEQGNPSVELLINEEYPATRKFPGAPQMRGSRVRFNWEVYDDRWVTIDQTILHDPKTDKIYRLVLKCEAACFKKNAKLASEISSSFTLKK
jgi:hypothetical protein